MGGETGSILGGGGVLSPHGEHRVRGGGRGWGRGIKEVLAHHNF